MIAADIRFMARRAKPLAKLLVGDARQCTTVPDGWATLVITSPPTQTITITPTQRDWRWRSWARFAAGATFKKRSDAI